MTTDNITVEFRLAWWAVPYVKTLAFFCHLMGTEPDYERLERVIKSAVRAVPVK